MGNRIQHQVRTDKALRQSANALAARLEAARSPSLIVTAEEAGLWPYARLPWRLQLRIHAHAWRQRIRKVKKSLADWWSVRRAIRVAVLFAAGALLLYELREWHDDRLTRNWQLVATPAPGNSGKITALEYLNSEFLCLPFKIELPLIGRCWKEQQQLTGINLSQETHVGRVDLNSADLSNARLNRANLSGAHFFYTNLSNANLSFARLSGAVMLRANLTSARLLGADLTDASIQMADLANANLRFANLSGVSIERSKVANAQLRGIWAWQEHRPVKVPSTVGKNIAYRKKGERWRQFVNRIRQQQPELEWEASYQMFNPDRF